MFSQIINDSCLGHLAFARCTKLTVPFNHFYECGIQCSHLGLKRLVYESMMCQKIFKCFESYYTSDEFERQIQLANSKARLLEIASLLVDCKEKNADSLTMLGRIRLSLQVAFGRAVTVLSNLRLVWNLFEYSDKAHYLGVLLMGRNSQERLHFTKNIWGNIRL